MVLEAREPRSTRSASTETLAYVPCERVEALGTDVPEDLPACADGLLPACGTSGRMIDHTGLHVTNPSVSRAFYEKALAPLGYVVLHEIPAQSTGGKVVFGMGVPHKPDFWVAEGEPESPRVHIAFRAESRAAVDAFYAAALAAGGRDNGSPGLRPHYHQHYYGAFVLDPDGHNVEAVIHTPQ